MMVILLLSVLGDKPVQEGAVWLDGIGFEMAQHARGWGCVFGQGRGLL